MSYNRTGINTNRDSSKNYKLYKILSFPTNNCKTSWTLNKMELPYLQLNTKAAMKCTAQVL